MPTLQKSLDGCYTRMLHAVLNTNQGEHITIKKLYGEQPGVSRKTASRRLRLAAHCHRHQKLPAGVVWTQNMDIVHKDIPRQHVWTS